MNSLAAALAGDPFAGYSYGYPHKRAYRALDPAAPLDALWAGQRRDQLFLYLHVPFCEVRCGFCNLFTAAPPGGDLVRDYLGAMRREAQTVRRALGDVQFSRLAIGGGTPTYLSVWELAELFDLAEEMGSFGLETPTSCEASPATLSREKLVLLKDRGVTRLSLGVQAFEEDETAALGRPQKKLDAQRAIELAKSAQFPILNLDLIYGGEGLSVAQFRESVREAVRWQPEEIYLYPLYVRPLTGLGKLAHAWHDDRLAMYRAGRDVLREQGYQQVSLRMFRGPQTEKNGSDEGPVYCCQQDGMVGLGCGARSYTRDLHYSTEYAVGKPGVLAILRDYLARPAESFTHARHGIRLDDEDQRRRFVIISLLQSEGLDRQAYAEQFAGDVLEHLPELSGLAEHGLATVDAGRIRLTDAGIERSDTLGPWLYSRKVQQLMDACELD